MASRAYVSWFNFKGAQQQRKVGTLSGGERNRVHLAKLLQRGSNLLLLDEPTNDLDVDTLRALEEALLNYAGCAVVISHDRWFLDRIATHMLAFEGDSRVVWFEGNYQDYEADRKRRLGAEADTPHRIKYRKLTRAERTVAGLRTAGEDSMNAEQAKVAAETDGHRAAEGECPTTVQGARRGAERQPRLQARCEVALGVGAGDASGDRRHLVPRQHRQRRVRVDPEAAKQAEAQFKTVDDVVAFYKKTFPRSCKALRAMPAEKLAPTIDFFGMMNCRRVQFIGFANNHSIHHRGQLAAYLRAMGSKVPSIYGGSADEPMIGPAAGPAQVVAP